MQEYHEAEDQLTALFGRRASSPGRNDELIRRQLDEARSLARRGELQTARELCAEVVLEHQLRLHDDRALLRRAIATLVHARAFQLLSRLLAAVDGRRLRIVLAPAAAGARHLIQRSETNGASVLAVNEALFRVASCDAVIDRWSEELARTRGELAEAAAG